MRPCPIASEKYGEIFVRGSRLRRQAILFPMSRTWRKPTEPCGKSIARGRIVPWSSLPERSLSAKHLGRIGKSILGISGSSISGPGLRTNMSNIRRQKAHGAAMLKKTREVDDMRGIFAQAMALHQKGFISDAQMLYKIILGKLPDHFDALHLLGVSECQIGQLDAADRLIRRGVVINPRSAAAHSNLGNVLIRSGRFADASASFDQAIALKSDYVEAFFNRGNVLGELKRF